LKGDDPPEFCDELKFEYAIDGVVTSWNKEEFLGKIYRLQKHVETVTILADPDFTGGGVEKEVEVAFRLIGYGQVKTFQLSHIYWSYRKIFL
jgi:5S rRNA maturation endonuclease (ribonuclease M5)